jgi:superfamily II DNA helicase RecQ
MTRAKQHLEITWSSEPSRFLAELGVQAPKPAPAVAPDDPVMKALKAWRLERSKKDEIPAFVVFHDKTLQEIARRHPTDIRTLATVPGIGPAKLERYGDEVLATLGKPR